MRQIENDEEDEEKAWTREKDSLLSAAAAGATEKNQLNTYRK